MPSAPTQPVLLRRDRPRRDSLRPALVSCVFLLAGLRGQAADLVTITQDFIDQNCASCHDDVEQKGGLDLTALNYRPDDPANLARWIMVVDRVSAGEMPPKQKRRPDAGATTDFLTAISRQLVSHEQTLDRANGRAPQRRLNREEYENTVRDLLHAPWLPLREMLPEDTLSHHFNKIGSALDVSHVHLASYLAAAEFALRAVIAPQASKPENQVRRYYAREQRSFVTNTKKFTNEPERMVIPVLGFQSQYELFGTKPPMTVGAADPSKRELEGFVQIASQFESYWMWFDQFSAPLAARYKLRFHTFSAWIGPSKQEPGMAPSWWIPDLANVMPSQRTEPVTIYAETYPRKYRLIGKFDAPIEPGVNHLEAWLQQGETIHPDASRFFRSRQGFWRYRNPLATEQGSPGIGFRWLEVEGPIVDEWPTAGHKLLFGDLPLREVAATPDRKAYIEIVSANPQRDADHLLRSFLAAAYRRPVEATDFAAFRELVTRVLQKGGSFQDAMITAYAAVLCSPKFLMLATQPGPLDDWALAERLAYFLHNTAPDEELLGLAAAGRLRDPTVLAAQTDRLLDSPRSVRFVNAFTDQWLDLRRINDISPDPVTFSDYYLDDLLNESAQEETRAFFTELIRRNLPARNLIDSDFVMVNERLAEHYALPPVPGVAIRSVPRPPGSPRGGILTQASVLKVTTDGNNSSPVKRGAWVMDRILGQPPLPPPPNVPAVEADTRGATTIRELLALHRSEETCASCHKNFDPAGFALENFDVAGGWRDRYRGVDINAVPEEGIGRLGQRFEFHYTKPVDASGELPDGTKFSNLDGLKRILLQREQVVARNLAAQLVTYATGELVRFSDRAELDALVARTEAKGYGVRSIIHEIVQSDLFRQK